MRKKTSKKTYQRPKPVVLVILDGFGIAPPNRGNAISIAKTPNLDRFITTYPATTLYASGEYVGLRWGEMGSSQVGHLNIGAGRVFYQDLMRITSAIDDKSFFRQKELLGAIEIAKKKKKKTHFIGLLSDAGVHSYNEHLFALIDLAQKQKMEDVYVHAILDGRDSPFDSAKKFILELESKMDRSGIGKIASLSGRFYAMDRDKNWDRTQKAYQAMVFGKAAEKFLKANDALEFYYRKKIYDEKLPPTVLIEKGSPVAIIEDGDSVITFNFRADRMRQLVTALCLPGFEKFERPYFKNLRVVTFTQYDPFLPVKVAFPAEIIKNSLAEVISAAGLKQLHVGESEKYAHITYFLNGGREKEFPGETRVLIPSIGSVSYADTPQMSAREITKVVIKAIAKDEYDFIAINYANADMVAHTGNLKATIQAIEILDECLGKIAKAVLALDGVLCITADHGNAEEVLKLQTNTIDKEHSTAPVPFIVVGKKWQGQKAGIADSLTEDLSILPVHGLLSDVAPTVLSIMGLRIPKEMTGKPLLEDQ